MLAVLEAWVSHTYHQVRLGNGRNDIARHVTYPNVTPPTITYMYPSQRPGAKGKAPKPAGRLPPLRLVGMILNASGATTAGVRTLFDR